MYRKRVRFGIERERCQRWKNVSLEMVPEELPLLLFQLLVPKNANPFFPKLLQPIVLPAGRRMLRRVERQIAADGGELFCRACGKSEERSLATVAIWARKPETRIMKNSSRLPLKMDRNRTRSRTGNRSSSASERTRRLNLSQLSSRLMNREAGSSGACASSFDARITERPGPGSSINLSALSSIAFGCRDSATSVSQL